MKHAMFLIFIGLSAALRMRAVASKQQRKIRDILGFFKKAGENAIKAISGLIPGSRPCSQMNTQPRGPKIPLNTINEDAIKPVIPYKRNEIQKSRNRSATKGKGIETV